MYKVLAQELAHLVDLMSLLEEWLQELMTIILKQLLEGKLHLLKEDLPPRLLLGEGLLVIRKTQLERDRHPFPVSS